jgi:hypothetical protein
LSAKHYVYDWSIELLQLADMLKALGSLLSNSTFEVSDMDQKVCYGLGSLLGTLAAELEFIQNLMPVVPNDYYYHRAARLIELLERSQGNERR